MGNGDTVRGILWLAPEVSAFFDGGGKIRALVRPVHGSRQVARSLLTLLARHPATTLDSHSVNGRTGRVVRYDRQVTAVIGLDVAGPPTSSAPGTGPAPLATDAQARAPALGGPGTPARSNVTAAAIVCSTDQSRGRSVTG
jgi:hypothetical protein